MSRVFPGRFVLRVEIYSGVCVTGTCRYVFGDDFNRGVLFFGLNVGKRSGNTCYLLRERLMRRK